MHHHYADITKKLGTPIWWDEYAVPRYCDFAPNEVANIYAREVALVKIECQNCRHPFPVAFSGDSFPFPEGKKTLKQAIKEGILHYGDPPHLPCCPAGPTMNCLDIRVIEFWEASKVGDWKRNAEYEVGLEDE